MKCTRLSVFMAFILVVLASCSKNYTTGKDVKGTITGKWNIESDSTFSSIGILYHETGYAGKAGDYFDFRTDNILYIKEDTVLDTLGYKVVSDLSVIIDSFGIGNLSAMSGASSIITLTNHNFIIYSYDYYTPGGYVSRHAYLKR